MPTKLKHERHCIDCGLLHQNNLNGWRWGRLTDFDELVILCPKCATEDHDDIEVMALIEEED